eukprot:5324574-Prymnesium_polylepis.1
MERVSERARGGGRRMEGCWDWGWRRGVVWPACSGTGYTRQPNVLRRHSLCRHAFAATHVWRSHREREGFGRAWALWVWACLRVRGALCRGRR